MSHIEQIINGNRLRLIVDGADFPYFRTTFDHGWERRLENLDATTHAVVMAASRLCGITSITTGGRIISVTGDSSFTDFSEKVREITLRDAVIPGPLPLRRLRDIFVRR